MYTLLYNARLVLPKSIEYGFVVVYDSKIFQVGFGKEYPALPYSRCIDLAGQYLAPGFVELHSHGAGGADFMDGTDAAFDTACATHLAHGTTTLLPTVIAATREEILRCLASFRRAKSRLDGRSLNLLGLHMEGPYLNPAQCGAIDPKHIRNPNPEEYEQFLLEGRGLIARWTLAVELEGAREFVHRLLQEGILPSIGHSNAVYKDVQEAFAWGVRHVTHLYSAMSSIVRHNGFRYCGVLESAFCIPNITVEVIADGCHLPAELLEMVYRVKGVEKVALTCDSMRCAGQDVPYSILGSLENGQKVRIEDGVAKLMDRSAFAGSIATDNTLIRTMYHKVGIPLHDAVYMMTQTPADIIGIGKEKGSLQAGKDADLVCFDEQIQICGVMVNGKGLLGILQ